MGGCTRVKNMNNELVKVMGVVQAMMPDLPYHIQHHAFDVYSVETLLAALEGVNGEDRLVLQTAALIHDAIFKVGSKQNELETAEFAALYLPTIGYSQVQAYRAANLVLATEYPTKPTCLLEEIICDADTAN